MSRKKPKPVEIVTSPANGTSAPILFDPDRLDFIGEFGGVTFRDATAKVVRQWLYDRLEEQVELVWEPVIKLITSDQRQDFDRTETKHKVYLVLEVTRYYIGIVPGSEDTVISDWEIRRSWDNKEDNLSESEFRYKHKSRGPFKSKDGKLALPRTTKVQYATLIDTWLPYSDEVWTGALQLVEATTELTRKIAKLVRSAEGQQQLLKVGLDLNLLALPSKTEDGK